jgi:hypothetical protein
MPRVPRVPSFLGPLNAIVDQGSWASWYIGNRGTFPGMVLRFAWFEGSELMTPP